jgi:hypothetical protein
MDGQPHDGSRLSLIAAVVSHDQRTFDPRSARRLPPFVIVSSHVL